jgi:hypothetical protein
MLESTVKVTNEDGLIQTLLTTPSPVAFCDYKGNPVPWVAPRRLAGAQTPREILQAWAPYYQDNGNLALETERYHSATTRAIMDLLAPYVAPEGTMCFMDDYGNHWRFAFNGTTAKLQPGKVTYEEEE